MGYAIEEVFGVPKAIIAMIHVRALPATPGYQGSLQAVIDQAVAEAQLYARAGVDALAIENMHDTPYLKGAVGPEITAAMTAVAVEVKRAVPTLPCGVQVLAGANREALAVALAAGLSFVRAEGFVFAHVADEGLIESCAGELLRYRRQIGADEIALLTDIKKKHSAHAITEDVDLAQTARAAAFFRSDAVVVTGAHTGEPAALDELAAVGEAVSLPVIVGSGVTAGNVGRYLDRCDAAIVGSFFKRDGWWENEVEAARVEALMAEVHSLR